MLHPELGPTAAIDWILVDANQERRRVDEVPAGLGIAWTFRAVRWGHSRYSNT
jgi:hypothetical protein